MERKEQRGDRAERWPGDCSSKQEEQRWHRSVEEMLHQNCCPKPVLLAEQPQPHRQIARVERPFDAGRPAIVDRKAIPSSKVPCNGYILGNGDRRLRKEQEPHPRNCTDGTDHQDMAPGETFSRQPHGNEIMELLGRRHSGQISTDYPLFMHKLPTSNGAHPERDAMQYSAALFV